MATAEELESADLCIIQPTYKDLAVYWHTVKYISNTFLPYSGGYVFGSSVRACVRAYLLTDFRQTFVTGASWDRDELIRFWGQRSRSQHDRIHPRFLCFRDISSIC